ncbi:MAG: GTPase [Candidatus Hydrogenedentota bacterium]
MQDDLGKALGAFDTALGALAEALESQPALRDRLFDDTAEWRALLTYKLVPHLSGEGCLVAAVAGGTNTGKSTVFNLLLGETASPVRTTAAATVHPVLAGNENRARQCLAGRLVPEFDARPLEHASEVLENKTPEATLFVHRCDSLPDRLVLLDTPDIDSIETRHWAVADNIRAAGDVLVAVVTPEKYKDERVIGFFRHAHAAGRVVLPVINKANDAEDFAVAQQQLGAFCADVGLVEPPLFALPQDPNIARESNAPVRMLGSKETLRHYLESVDVAAIKRRVYRDTLAQFLNQAGAFAGRVAESAGELRRVVAAFEELAANYAQRYDPAPGPEVGALFHQFVQSKRGGVARTIGNASATVARGALGASRAVRRAILRRTKLEAPDAEATESQRHKRHRELVTRIAHDLATRMIDTARNLPAPVDTMLLDALDHDDLDKAAARVAAETLRTESISEDFRRHAEAMLEDWWENHPRRRQALLALDTVLAVLPAAIAAPVSIYVGGIGLPEAMIFAGPLMEQFVVRVIEYEFGDAMFDFLSPWRAEQRQHLAGALQKHLVDPVLSPARGAVAVLESDTAQNLRDGVEACRKAL